MSFSGTYLHTVLVGLDDFGASVLFNEPDLTISSMCGLLHRADLDKEDAVLGLHPWQRGLLRAIRAGLEAVRPGHCERAIAADEARARRTIIFLQQLRV